MRILVISTLMLFGSLTRGFPQEGQHGLRLTLVLDTSTSTKEVLRISKTVGVDLVERLDETRDLAQVVVFGGKVEIAQEYTSNRARLKSTILGLQPGGTTSLYNAVYIALRSAQESFEDGRSQVIVVVSDGDDTSSRITADHLRVAADEVEAEHNPARHPSR